MLHCIDNKQKENIMLPFKNVGIFGEAEERHEKMIKRLSAMSALMKLIETIESYPKPPDPREQIILDEMLKIVLEKFDQIYNDD